MTTGTLATKGDEVEEWLDLRFFRPIGIRLARALAPTWVSPDQVTMWSLATGLVAGHLFFYQSIELNAIGWVLFIVSDIFDSVDGQLARLRGTSTPLGRMLDGLSDSARFINLYAHLGARLIVFLGWPVAGAIALALAALLSHTWQAAAVDFIRHAFLAMSGQDSELELPEDLQGGSLKNWLYGAWVRRQASMFPATVALERQRRQGTLSAAAQEAYLRHAAPLLGRCMWLGQNVRWLLLLVTVVPGWPAAMLWITVVPLNLILFVFVWDAEHIEARS
ncbi:MAG TPA: CDP-alcohol phosphatidyltransferase family protein [Gemmatimonadaceae bacterium]|nr:CDP-alcohol phosphatidyltransferase family protein [Gemmatimonadaceae bacterium]